MKALALLFLSSAFCQAQTISVPSIEIGAKIYTNCSVVKIDAANARITHSEGVSRTPIPTLPISVQTQLGYDPDKAAAHQRLEAKVAQQQSTAAAAEAKAAEIKKLPLVHFWIESNTSEGLVVGTYDLHHSVVASSSASIGGGGGAVGFQSEVRSHRTYYFMPHTKGTHSLASGSDFWARYKEDGTQRINDSEVLKKYLALQLQLQKPETTKSKGK